MSKADFDELPASEKNNGKAYFIPDAQGSEGEIGIDNELSDTSENPVQNKVIKAAIGDLTELETTEKESLVGAINEVRDFENLTNRPVKEVTSITSLINPIPVKTESKWEEKSGILFYNGRALCAINNVNIYINSDTGVDDIDNGYGFSVSKPFASLEYAQQFFPVISCKTANGLNSIFNIHLQGTFTSDNIKGLNFEQASLRTYLIIENNTIFNNYTLQLLNNQYFIIRLKANLTFNITKTDLTSGITVIKHIFSNCVVDRGQSSENSFTITINGNSNSKNYINGVECSSGSKFVIISPNINLSINNCSRAVSAGGASQCTFAKLSGSNLNIGLEASFGGILTYATNTMSATTATKTSSGGRIYTGSQS